ncbi:MAG: hypothetical protein JNL29_08435, partial [Nitrospira sp.]|nr:hypothetical protein [Nitrospira sp.]
MMTLISQMIGCLLIAAGIGFGVGWWLRQIPKRSTEKPSHDAAGLLRNKEQALEAMAHDLKVKTSAVQILEQKVMSSETLHSSVQRELIARNERLKALEAELTTRSKQLTTSEGEGAVARRRVSEIEAILATQTHELREAQQTCRNAEQARDVMEREVGILRDHIAQLNEGLADRDRLRTQVKQLETAQDRIHQLEIELSDREAAHRTTIQQLEQALIDRDLRIEKLVPVTHILQEKEAALKEWERTHMQTVQTLERESAKLLEQNKIHEDLQARHHLAEQRVLEREAQLATLQRELQELQTERHALRKEVESIPEKDEQIERLQKRLKELRANLRTSSTTSATTPSPRSRQNATEITAPNSPPKSSKSLQGDDLKKIEGIGPVFAETLQKLGTRTFIQIARWKPEDVEKIAKKLATDPERIKRENWIAGAKKQHYEK